MEDDWTDWAGFFWEGILSRGGLAENFVGIGGVLWKNHLGERGSGFGGIGQYWILDVLLLFRYPFSGSHVLNRNKNWEFVLFVAFLGVIVAA